MPAALYGHNCGECFAGIVRREWRNLNRLATTTPSGAHQKDSCDPYFESVRSFLFFLTHHGVFGKTRLGAKTTMAGHGFPREVDSACAEFTDVPARIHGQLEQTKEQRKEINL